VAAPWRPNIPKERRGSDRVRDWSTRTSLTSATVDLSVSALQPTSIPSSLDAILIIEFSEPIALACYFFLPIVARAFVVFHAI
jgi:hypothetical protein